MSNFDKFIQHIKNSYDCFVYTFKHKIAFLKVQYQVLGSISLAGVLHDTDKLLMYTLLIPKRYVRAIHRSYSLHHANKNGEIVDIWHAIIDWECARYTKKDKPLNARETAIKFYPRYANVVNSICDVWGI